MELPNFLWVCGAERSTFFPRGEKYSHHQSLFIGCAWAPKSMNKLICTKKIFGFGGLCMGKVLAPDNTRSLNNNLFSHMIFLKNDF